ncbi:MAG: DUF3105 domain-containing protein [Deltaproteobacteria bacterium]|nr:DUF3105 domain-containing protein [Deltaproteobacteria bacterium]
MALLFRWLKVAGELTSKSVAGGAIVGLSACGASSPAPEGRCDTVTRETPEIQPGTHVPAGTPIEWNTNPPSSGPHFGAWARWGESYVEPVLDRGYWVHNLEHGGVVVALKCDALCGELVDRVKALDPRLPVEPICEGVSARRWLIVRDPLLPEEVQVAAVAWGVTSTARCLDEDSLTEFVSARLGSGPEKTCAQGSAPE